MDLKSRVSFSGREGTVVGFMPAGMVDVRFDDTGTVERRHESRLQPVARPNGGRRVRRARRNSPEQLQQLLSQAAELRMGLASHVRGSPEQRADEARLLEIENQIRTLRLSMGMVSLPAGYQVPRGRKEAEEGEKTAAQQDEEKEREQKSAYRRTAGRPEKQVVEANLEKLLPLRGAVMFTEADPPRVTADRRGYCGNPIDGVAYFIVLDKKRVSLARWLTQEEFSSWARDHKRDRNDESFELFLEALAAKNIRVVKERAAARKYVRPKATMGLPTDLAIREKKAGSVGAEADPSIHYYEDGDLGERYFFKVYTSVSPGMESLARFSLYGKKVFSVPDLTRFSDADIARWGKLTLAVSEGAKSEPTIGARGIHPELASALIRSGAVSIVSGWSRVIQPNTHFSAFSPGDRLEVGLFEKSKSPYFSWVPSIMPLRGAQAARECTTPEDRAVQRKLSGLKGVLSRLDAGYNRVRSLFHRLGEDPTALRISNGRSIDVQQTVVGLSGAFAAMIRWYNGTVEEANLGNQAALRAFSVFQGTVLNPDDEFSPFNDAMKSLRSSSTFAGLVAGSEWMVYTVNSPPKLMAANLANAVRRLQKRGYEVQVVSKELGLLSYRVPPSKVQPMVSDQNTYDLFMQALLRLILEENPIETGETQEEVGTVLTTARRPGVSALLFFSSNNPEQSVPFPLDDFYRYIRPSLDQEPSALLVELRKKVGEKGANWLRWARPTKAYRDQMGTARDEKDESAKAALRLSQALGLYATGGVQTESGTMDPLDTRFAFTLRPPPMWPISFEDQKDQNWAIALVVNHVYPSLVWRRGLSPKEAGFVCAELILLAMLYSLLGGYLLTGPLNPGTKVSGLEKHKAFLASQQKLLQLQRKLQRAEKPERADKIMSDMAKLQQAGLEDTQLLAVAKDQVQDAESDLLGGAGRGLGAFQAFMTYNPVLFEMTRLFWPKGNTDTPFSSIMSLPHKAMGVDTTGRFGFVMGTTQEVAASSESEEEVQYRLQQLLSPGAEEDPSLSLQGKVSVDGKSVRAAEGTYTAFVLNWPLGATGQGALDAAQHWVNDPLAYLKYLKGGMEEAVTMTLHTRRVGLRDREGVYHRPKQDMPFLFTDRPGIEMMSAVNMDTSPAEFEMVEIIQEIDRALEELNRGGK